MRKGYDSHVTPSAKRMYRRLAWAAAAGVCLAFASWLALCGYGSYRLGAARARFAREVAPLPAAGPLRPELAMARERALWRRVAAAGPLAAGDGLRRARAVLSRPPVEWSTQELTQLRQLLAANAEILAAAHRAAEASEPPAEREVGPWQPWAPANSALVSQAMQRATLLWAEIGLGVRDRSPQEIMRAVRALAAEVAAFQREPGALFQVVGANLENKLLHGIAWIFQEGLLGQQDLETIRRALSRPEQAGAIGRLVAAEAAYALRMTATLSPGAERLPGCDAAELLDGFRRFAVESRKPFLEAQRAVTAQWRRAAQPGSVAEVVLPLLLPNFSTGIGQLQANAASRQLAGLAIELRLVATRRCAFPDDLSRLPSAAQPDPFAGGLPLYAQQPGGGVLLANPAASRAFRAGLGHAVPPPFEWWLPHPCRPEVRAGLVQPR
ncbi:MAG TPA: hypothetical protein VHQ90_15825 [Thermoanaerobaculia bacterium]|nr:hypothetical protein [Thermoanaerobaculia bacterium]